MILGHLQKCLKLHLHSLSIPIPFLIKIELIFTLQAVASEIQADFQKCHIWAYNLETRIQKLHRQSLSKKWQKLCLLCRQRLLKYMIFLETVIFGIILSHRQKSQNFLHIHTFSTPGGRN